MAQGERKSAHRCWDFYLVFRVVSGLVIVRRLVRIVGGLVRGLVVVRLGIAVVLDISDVAGVVVSLVGNGLGATIGQVGPVGSRHVALAIAGLLMGVVVVAVLILHVPGEIVGPRGLLPKKTIVIPSDPYAIYRGLLRSRNRSSWCTKGRKACSGKWRPDSWACRPTGRRAACTAQRPQRPRPRRRKGGPVQTEILERKREITFLEIYHYLHVVETGRVGMKLLSCAMPLRLFI